MISTKFYDGLEVVIYIAQNAGANPVSSKEICGSQGVLPRHLEPLMQLLVHSGILRGTKGPKGGYSLAKEKRKITAGDIYRVFIDAKTDTKTSILQREIIMPLHAEIQADILQKLDSLTIESLCKNFKKSEKDADKSAFFNI